MNRALHPQFPTASGVHKCWLGSFTSEGRPRFSVFVSTPPPKKKVSHSPSRSRHKKGTGSGQSDQNPGPRGFPLLLMTRSSCLLESPLLPSQPLTAFPKSKVGASGPELLKRLQLGRRDTAVTSSLGTQCVQEISPVYPFDVQGTHKAGEREDRVFSTL